MHQIGSYTMVETRKLQSAYDFFNDALFDGKLPQLMIVFQRHANSAGYFAPNRWDHRADQGSGYPHELALNPDGFVGRTDGQILSTLVHEMVHVRQQHFGKPSRSGYHNRQWAAMMIEVGLMPSNTGMVGGKQTGVHMSHYIIHGGRYEHVFADLAASGWQLGLQSRQVLGPQGRTRSSKTKFSCPHCGANAWGKPDLHLLCEPCLTKVVEQAFGDREGALRGFAKIVLQAEMLRVITDVEEAA